MKLGKSIVCVLSLSGVIALGGASASAESAGVVSRQALGAGNYCHMKFEAIQDITLGQAQPVLQDNGSADVVDFYGPCDHDPLGQDEIHAQELSASRRSIRDYGE